MVETTANDHEFCEKCGGANPAIQKIAEELDFTYDEALTYVMVVGLAYAHQPPRQATEPGE